MKRRPLLAGNWKMHLNIADAVDLAKNVAAAAEQSDRDVMIAPAFTALSAVAKALKGSRLFLGAQNVAWEAQGSPRASSSAPGPSPMKSQSACSSPTPGTACFRLAHKPQR